MQDNEKQVKRNQFRTQIRRKQIRQYFEQQRTKLAQNQIIAQQQFLIKQLDLPEKKKQWIYAKRKQLGNIPQKSWFQILRTLSVSMTAFSNGDFTDWIQTGLIQLIIQNFRQEYKELDLSKISACILQDIFYYLPIRSQQVDRILEYEFILDLVELCADTSTTAQYYYQLIVSILSSREYLRNMFIDSGIVQILANRLKMYTDYDSDQVYCALSLTYRLVKTYNSNGVESMPKGNVVSIFIPILDAYLTVVKNQDSLRVILKSFATLANTQKQHILSNLYGSPNLINFLLIIISKQGNPFQRSAAAGILASILSSQNVSYAQQLLKKGLLDILLVCSKMQNNQYQCSISMIQIISNIVVNSLDEARKVVSHDIFGHFIIPLARKTQNLKTHQNAIFTIASLLQYNNYQLSQTLLKKYSILQIFVNSLSNSIPSLNNCLQILRSLINLVKMYEEIYTDSQNRITMELEKYFNINNVLTALQQKVDNKRVHNYINILLSTMNGVQ